MKGKKPQPKQANQLQKQSPLQKPQQPLVQEKQQEKPQIVKVEPIIEPPKPKINFGLQDLKNKWELFNLDKDVKIMIVDHFKSISQPMQQQIKVGSIDVPDKPIDDFGKILKKQMAKLKKHEFEEGLIHMRLKHNLLSQKEYDERKKFIAKNIEQIPDKEKEFQDKLGLKDYFINRNNNLIQSTIELSGNKQGSILGKSKLDIDITSSKTLIPSSQQQFGSLTERGKSKHKFLRDNSQSVNISQLHFKNDEERIKHEEFIKKLKDEQKQRKKLRKQLELLQLQKNKQLEDKTNKEKEQKDNQDKEQKKKKFLEMQELLAKKEKERQEQKHKQDDELNKLFNYQPLHIKMESHYKQDVEMPLLEQKKKRLEEIRQFYKQPMDKKDILQHMKKYESEAEAKQIEREKKKRQMMQEFNKRNLDIYESKAVEMDLKMKEDEEEKEYQRKQVKERMNEYYESIKGMINFKDDSLIKKKEKSVILNPASKSLKGSMSARGLPNLRGSSQSQNSVDLLYPANPSRSTNRMNNEKSKIQSEIVWKSDFTIMQQNKLKKEQELKIIKDKLNKREYLQQILRSKDTQKKIDVTDIDKYLEDNQISDRERFDLVKLRAQQLEEKARLDEQLLLMDEDDTEAVEKAIGVNDLYIKSIQAKLKMLNAD